MSGERAGGHSRCGTRGARRCACGPSLRPSTRWRLALPLRAPPGLQETPAAQTRPCPLGASTLLGVQRERQGRFLRHGRFLPTLLRRKVWAALSRLLSSPALAAVCEHRIRSGILPEDTRQRSWFGPLSRQCAEVTAAGVGVKIPRKAGEEGAGDTPKPRRLLWAAACLLPSRGSEAEAAAARTSTLLPPSRLWAAQREGH